MTKLKLKLEKIKSKNKKSSLKSIQPDFEIGSNQIHPINTTLIIQRMLKKVIFFFSLFLSVQFYI